MTTYCGVDFHARQQHVAWKISGNDENSEIKVQKLLHSSRNDVREFYLNLPRPVIVGIEASGYSEWFEDMLFELGHEVRIGDASEIRKRARSRHKNDRRDAELILDLLVKDEFPQVYRPTPQSRTVLEQLRYRRRLVKIRTSSINHLHAISLNACVSLKGKVLTINGRAKLESLDLSPSKAEERKQWFSIIDTLTPKIKDIEKQLVKAAKENPLVGRIETIPGVGDLTALAIIHTLGPVERFSNSRKVSAYAGLDPREHTSDERKRMGHISKCGSRLLRFQLIEAATTAVRIDPELKRRYWHIAKRRDQSRAKVAIARHILIRAFILLRDEIDYAEFQRRAVAVRSARKDA